LSGLYPLPTSWPDNVDASLRQLFPALQRAVAAFRPYLPAWRRWAFDRAWNEYRCGTGRDIDLQNYHHYIGFQSNPNTKENFRRNIDRLLALHESFAGDQEYYGLGGHRGPDRGFGRWRAARCAAAPEALDDDHAAAATRARRAMVCCGAGG
jgi:hypothetical protein